MPTYFTMNRGQSALLALLTASYYWSNAKILKFLNPLKKGVLIPHESLSELEWSLSPVLESVVFTVAFQYDFNIKIKALIFTFLEHGSL